ncbi:hypothetical protein MSAN_01640500 [Mycena sanguinolenta]|uniref:Uncharacterized protein n=1 Tax=Mycena sanguinolenta TaxID=230812 RepID=A0A8H6XYR1_9AGAR|nr:hypothetical protein MSAN_01640500 [Mycena sanguinolenta]
MRLLFPFIWSILAILATEVFVSWSKSWNTLAHLSCPSSLVLLTATCTSCCYLSIQMLSKLLAFGLGALAIARAVPAVSFDNHPLSYSLNLATAVAPIQSSDPGLELGLYRIYSDGFGWSQLFAHALDYPIYLDRLSPSPHQLGLWGVEKTADGSYLITNVGIETRTNGIGGCPAVPIKFLYDWVGITRLDKCEPLLIKPAGKSGEDDTYTIASLHSDLVWTADTRSDVHISHVDLQSRDSVPDDASRWIFRKTPQK